MNPGGVEHRAARVSFVTGLSTILSVALQLISVPVCLKYWGKDMYGMWLAVFAAFTMMKTVNVGFTTFVGNKLNLLYHEDHKALQRTLASSASGILVLGSIQLLVTLFVVGADQMTWLLGVSNTIASEHRASMALFILIVTWVLTGSYLGIVHRLLIPAGLMYQAAWWSMGFQVSQFSIIMLAAVMDFDLLKTSLLFAFVQATIYLASAVYIRWRLPAFYPWWIGGTVGIGLKDLARSTFLTVSSIIQQGANSGIVILVAAISGPAVVPVFTTVRTVANLWTNVTNVLTTPLLPDVIRYHAKQEGDKLIAISEAHWWLLGSVVNLGILVSYPLIGSLFSYWTSHTIVLDKTLLSLLLGGVALMSAGAIMNMYLNGINNMKAILGTTLVRSFFSLVLGGILLNYLGLAGLGLGIFIGELIALVVMAYFFFIPALSGFGARLNWISFAPLIAGTMSVLIFLISEALGGSASSFSYPLSVLGVMLASWWGWSRQDTSTQKRFLAVVHHWLG